MYCNRPVNLNSIEYGPLHRRSTQERRSLPRTTDQLAELLKHQLSKPTDLSDETDLISDLALESVQIMEFIVDVEDHYDIAISLEALGEVRTLGQLAALVDTLLESS